MSENDSSAARPSISPETITSGGVANLMAEFHRLVASYERMKTVGIMDAPALLFDPVKVVSKEVMGE